MTWWRSSPRWPEVDLYCAITAEPIDVAALAQRVRSDADGAVLIFAGVVRDHDAGRIVENLRYEAYAEMAEGKLRAICEEVKARLEIGDVAVAHRIGELGIGEVSVALAVAAPHRDAAYAASRQIIERLKREVPIWKRQRFSDGSAEWLDGARPVDE